MSERRVVITGLGPVTPIGIGAPEFWSALLEGRNAVRRTKAFDPARFDSQVAAEIEGLSVADYVPKRYRKSARIMARDIELAVAAAHLAITDAGLVTKSLIDRGDTEAGLNVDPARMGANIGAGTICADLSELSEALASASVNGEFCLKRWGAEGMQNLTPLWLLKFLPNMLACHVTIVHDCQGPSNTITCGEASSHLAIGEAFRGIARGVADVCVCGGAESKINPMAVMRQSLGKRLSTRNDAPEAACRPFASDRDGTVCSEGGGLVILEELQHAKARGARIYAELVGFGASNDATGTLKPAQDGRGVALAIKKALNDAKAAPADIDMIGAFATGLVDRDLFEARGLRTAFGDELKRIPVLATKGGMGNNGAGAGAIDFIASVLALHNNTVPPSVNAGPREGECDLRVVTDDPIDANAEMMISLSYALTGMQNAALVIRRFRD